MELGDQQLTTTLFQQFPIRRTWHADEWWYSLVDCMAPFANTTNTQRYWSDIKRKLVKEGANYEDFVTRLPMPTADGRMQKTDCATLTGVLRVLQAVPSEKAEPFKQWLAQVGAVTLETEDVVGEQALRAEYRLQLHRFDGSLHELVAYRGIVTPAQHQALDDANYAGLYAVSSEQALARLRHLPFTGKPPEFMGAEEIGINIFQRTQAAARIKERDLHGSQAINAAAEDVGVEIRLTLERLGRPMPEDLPRHKILSRGEWVPENELAKIDWDSDADAQAPADDAGIRVIEIEAPKED